MASVLDGGFYFLRHGESAANRARVIAGSTDSPLTPTGRLQAGSAVDRLLGVGIAAIYTSPQSRAADTAAIVARALELPVTRIADLRERDWGEMEGQSLDAITDRSITPAGGESKAGFEARVMAALAGLAGPHPALVVAHSGVLRTLRNVLGPGDEPGWIGNALPVHCAPGPDSGHWRFTPFQ